MLSLYIHTPFCVRKCHYCGFYSTVYSASKADEFLQALELEMQALQGTLKRAVETIFIGGGTPTALSEEQLARLVHTIKGRAVLDSGAEWTAEANPNSLSERKLSLLRDGGVNRLSLGVQSFSDAVLRTLGRLHDSRQAEDAVLLARRAGFSNIGLDLIYGVPGQSGGEWNDSVERALEVRPEHVSLYCLSLDEGSRFASEAAAGRFPLPDDETAAAMYETAAAGLQGAGYVRYEISNFALPGFACRHNLNYWKRGEYLGLGPSAWSFLGNRRWRTLPGVAEYCRMLKAGRDVAVESETIVPEQAASESVMLGLRTIEGVDLAGYERQFGAGPRTRLEGNAASLEQAGLIRRERGRLVLSDRGILVSNEVAAKLIL